VISREDTVRGPVVFIRRTNTATPAGNVVGGDELGRLVFVGKDLSGNYASTASARISAFAEAPFQGDPTSVPGALAFYTAPANSVTNTERMRIASTGEITIGTAGTGIAQIISGVDGTVRIINNLAAAVVLQDTQGTGAVTRIVSSEPSGGSFIQSYATDTTPLPIHFTGLGDSPSSRTMVVDIANNSVLLGNIGHSTPQATLDVSGAMRLKESLSFVDGGQRMVCSKEDKTVTGTTLTYQLPTDDGTYFLTFRKKSGTAAAHFGSSQFMRSDNSLLRIVFNNNAFTAFEVADPAAATVQLTGLTAGDVYTIRVLQFIYT
jgi:hypothetical protein